MGRGCSCDTPATLLKTPKPVRRECSYTLSRDREGGSARATEVGNFGIYMAYAMMSSGHLPLMSFIFLLALSGEGLVAKVAWDQRCLDAQYVQNLVALKSCFFLKR